MKTSIITCTTGGGVLNNRLFSVKSFTLKVADIIISFSGLPFCNIKRQIHANHQSVTWANEKRAVNGDNDSEFE